MPEDFHIDLIRKSATELLDACEAYSSQLKDTHKHGKRVVFVGLMKWLTERLLEIAKGL